MKTHSSNKEQESRREGTLSNAQEYPPLDPTMQQLPGSCRIGHTPPAGAQEQEKRAFQHLPGQGHSEALEMFKAHRQLSKINVLKAERDRRGIRGWEKKRQV